MSMSRNWKPGDPRPRPTVVCGKGRVKQSFKKGSDINNIMARYMKTGQLDHVSKEAPVFADVSKMGDFHSVLQRIKKAKDSFSRLPSSVRARFRNRPEELVAFMQDPANKAEAIELGLLSKPVVTEPVAPVKAPAGAVVPPKEDLPTK